MIKKLRKGYAILETGRRGQRSAFREPAQSMLEGDFSSGLASGMTGMVEATIKEQPLQVAARQPLPIRQDAPMEMIIRHPEPEPITEGIEIPSLHKRVKFGKLNVEETHPIKTMVYPLIPSEPKKGEPIFAYAKIYWDDKTNKYMYEVVEPKLNDKLSNVLAKIKELLEQKLDIDFSKLKLVEAGEYLKEQIAELINYFHFKITPTEEKILRYYVERDFIGLGRIEPIMRDNRIEDISCDGIGIPIFIYHRNPALGSVMTSVGFENGDELDSFITRLVQLSGKSISVINPLVDASLPDGSRLQATLATDIARRGSNFTIRRFSEEPLTPIHLLNYGTLDAKSLAYLWMAVDFGRSILISGGTASGKTSLLNVLSLFIRSEKKIVSIEDTAELRLPHPHWVPVVARTPISSDEGKTGEVDMFSLLKESFRQRPDYIIVGEVRGKEAYILFQQIATGHPSIATIHAENLNKLADRLTTQPISLPKSLVSSLDIVVFQLYVRHRDKSVRRVNEILEIMKFDPDAVEPSANRIVKWNPIEDTFDITGKSIVFKKISEATGIKPADLLDEFQRRILVLEWMQEKNIIDFESVHKIIGIYYANPKSLLARILGES